MKLTGDEISLINSLNNLSAVQAKDCLITDNVICFLVDKKDVGRAVGKSGNNIRELGSKTKKRIEIMEFHPNIGLFVKSSLPKIKVRDVSTEEVDGKKIVFVSLDSENRRKILGSMGRLKRIKELAKRNYKVDDIRIK